MAILEELNAPTFKTSKSDRILICYIQDNIQLVARKTISQLSQESGIGESTITRFARKMGFSSLPAFKLALAEELTDTSQRYIINRDIAAAESVELTARKLLDTNIGMMEKTLQLLDFETISESSRLLQHARRILFVGLGNAGYMAKDSSYKFSRIGLDCMGTDNSHTMIVMAALLHPDDLLVAISHSGETEEIIKTVELAKRKGVKTIVITANKKSTLSVLSDQGIFYEAEETLLETGSIPVKLAQFFILDLIYTQVVKEMADVAAENKRLTTQAISYLHRQPGMLAEGNK
ncbi:MAG: MurR/RpiR family transcriptional regulator [Selenomonadaceae bacterium]